MTSRVTLRHLRRGTSVGRLPHSSLVVSGAQASADPGQTRFTIEWSACESSPQTQYGTLKVPLDWSKPSAKVRNATLGMDPWTQ
jgi:hypothetical protein